MEAEVEAFMSDEGSDATSVAFLVWNERSTYNLYPGCQRHFMRVFRLRLSPTSDTETSS